MKQILTNYRYYLLALLAMIAVAGVFSEPTEGLSFSKWARIMIASKAIGLSAGYVAYRLAARWEKQGVIPELTEITNDISA